MDAMLSDLGANARHPDLPERHDVYGRLIGSWKVDNRYYDEAAGEWRTGTRRWHFSRILDGLGVQDVLRDGSGVGTTVRVFDRRAGVWRVGWYGPASGEFATLVGRADGDGIVQEGTDGRPIRWNFPLIAADRFNWKGYVSDDGGTTWRLEQEMRARRSA